MSTDDTDDKEKAMQETKSERIDAALFGRDLFGNPLNDRATSPTSDRFLFPPFSLLDARQGDWQARKRKWTALGIASEIGRSAKTYNTHEWVEKINGKPPAAGDGTSIFDPVLCECVYRWFSIDGAQVVDPFAGGSVRGVVASMLGRKYWGCDIRQEQVTANQHQGLDLGLYSSASCPETSPVWVCGDAMEALHNAPKADLVFSCPPYGDLERYSDDAKDLSTMEWHTFSAAYRRIVHRAANALRDDRFACFVVGDLRDRKTGSFRDLVGLTVDAFRDQNMGLYNHAILATPTGSACLRAGKQFTSGRKLVSTHQHVLVFCKGDWRNAAKSCGVVEGAL